MHDLCDAAAVICLEPRESECTWSHSAALQQWGEEKVDHAKAARLARAAMAVKASSKKSWVKRPATKKSAEREELKKNRAEVAQLREDIVSLLAFVNEVVAERQALRAHRSNLDSLLEQLEARRAEVPDVAITPEMVDAYSRYAEDV